MEEALHPTQGLLPDGRLDTQPSTQLPVMAFGSLASRCSGDSRDADGVGAVGDVREDTVLRATVCWIGLCGLATCFGASTMTSGSVVVAPPESVAVCDIAVPLSSSGIDKAAAVGLATKSDENFIVHVL
jgi:hypothetical protein